MAALVQWRPHYQILIPAHTNFHELDVLSENMHAVVAIDVGIRDILGRY